MYEFELECPMCGTQAGIIALCDSDGHKWLVDLEIACGCYLSDDQRYELERDACYLADMEREAALEMWSDIRAER